MAFEGIQTPVMTPYGADGDVDYKAYAEILEAQITTCEKRTRDWPSAMMFWASKLSGGSRRPENLMKRQAQKRGFSCCKGHLPLLRAMAYHVRGQLQSLVEIDEAEMSFGSDYDPVDRLKDGRSPLGKMFIMDAV